MLSVSDYVRVTLVPLLGAVVLACAHSGDSGSKVPASGRPQFGAWGVETDQISTVTAPGDDFYRYVNEGWLRSTKLPPGRPVYSAPWVVQAAVSRRVKDILAAATSTTTDRRPAQRRIGDLFASCVDEGGAARGRGLADVLDELQQILAISTHEQVAQWMARPRSSALFRLVIQPPPTMRGSYRLTIAQYRVTGLGLPGQVYYESEDPSFAGHRNAYQAYMAATLARAGVDRADDRARRLLALESAFARVMWDFAKLRDAGASFRSVRVSELPVIAPGFPWAAFLDARGLTGIDGVNLGVGAIVESAALFDDFDVDDWRSYLAFHWIHSHSRLLPEPFARASFDFYRRRLLGVKERPTREQECVRLVQRSLGDDVGQVFVREYFPQSHRQKVELIATYVARAFRERLTAADWMDDATRAEAVAKLDAVVFEIGYPNVSRDWSGLTTDPTDLVGNYARLTNYRWRLERRRIGQPITRFGDWNLFPHRIGAGYHQQYNKIFITAGALLPPFFDPNADPAVNFGAIGQTIGHEFGHAFDDQGSRFDSAGALRDWWSDASRRAYTAKTRALISQFRRFEPVVGAPLAAEQMIGEIVGDLTGASIGYRAYELYAADHFEGAPPVLNGFTGPQRFFLAMAQQYRTVATEAALRDMALHESHPPAEFRINGSVRNVAAWYRAFAVDDGAELFLPPEARVVLW